MMTQLHILSRVFPQHNTVSFNIRVHKRMGIFVISICHCHISIESLAYFMYWYILEIFILHHNE